MTDILFYLFAAAALASALAVVLGGNAVNGAMMMILAFGSTAALYVLLDAWFLAALQLIVYAGAVMVLFIFIVMLLNPEKTADMKLRPLVMTFAGVVAIVLVFGVVHALHDPSVPVQADLATRADATLEPEAVAYGSSPAHYGYGLFGKYMLPVQVAGILLLIAMIGVIVISKKLDGDGQATDGR